MVGMKYRLVFVPNQWASITVFGLALFVLLGFFESKVDSIGLPLGFILMCLACSLAFVVNFRLVLKEGD